jgi:hypothetical protein
MLVADNQLATVANPLDGMLMTGGAVRGQVRILKEGTRAKCDGKTVSRQNQRRGSACKHVGTSAQSDSILIIDRSNEQLACVWSETVRIVARVHARINSQILYDEH